MNRSPSPGFSPTVRSGLRLALVNLAYLGLFFLLDRFCLSLQTYPGVVAWNPAHGLSFAMLLVFGAHFIPAVALASLGSSYLTFKLPFPPMAALVWALFTPAIYALAAMFLRRIRFDGRLRHTRDLIWLYISSAAIAIILAIVFASISVSNASVLENQRFQVIFQRWIGEVTGVLTFTPFLLVHVLPWVERYVKEGLHIRRPDFPPPSRKVIIQALSLFAIVFLIPNVAWWRNYQPLFLIVVPLVWITLDHALAGVSLSIAAVNWALVLAVWLSGRIDPEQFSLWQLELLVISVASLLNGSIFMEARRSKSAAPQSASAEMYRRRMAVAGEFLTILVAATYVWALEYTFDFYESITEWEALIGLKGLDETIVMVTFLGLAFTLFAFKRWREVQKEIIERHKVEAELHTLNLELEQRVQARTAELSKANQSLQAEIAERAQAEQALKHSEERFRALIENNADAITLLDANGVVIYDSPSAPGMLGFGPEDWINRNAFELMHPDDLPEMLDRFQNLLDSPGGRIDATFRLRHKNGSWLWIEAVVTNTLGDPAVGAVIVNYRDVTTRKLTQEALVASEDRYRDLVENSLDLICTHDLEGRLLSVNPHAERSLGYPVGVLLNRNIPDFLEPETKALFEAYLDTIKEEGAAKGTIKVRTKQGEVRIWEFHNTLRTEGVTTPIVRGMARDVTEQKRAEEQVLSISKFPAENPNPVMRFAPDGSLLYANEAGELFRRCFGDGGDLTVPDELKAHILATFASGVNKEIEIKCNGRTFSCILTPIRDAGYLNLYGRDITDRRTAELALEKSEERFRSLFENTPISIWDEDFSEVKRYLDTLAEEYAADPETYFNEHPEVVQKCLALVKVIDVNQASLKLYEASEKTELLGNLEKAFTSLPRVEFQQELTAMIRGATQLRMDARVRTLRDRERIVQMNWSVLPGHERDYSRVLVSLSDITERRLAEQEAADRTNKLLMLYGLSRALAGADDLEEIYALVNRHAVESLELSYARIAILEGDRLVIRAAHAARVVDNERQTGKSEPLSGLPFLRSVLDQDEPVILHTGDSQANARERSFLQLDSTQLLCLTPLHVGRSSPSSKHLMGLLVLGQVDDERKPFTPGNLNLVQSIGNQAAVAIRRVLLHNQTERRLQQIGALRDIDRAIASSADLQLSADVILSHLITLLKVDAATLWVMNPDTMTLEFKAGRGFRSRSFDRARPLRLGEGYAGRAIMEHRTIRIDDLAERQDNPHLMRALQAEAFESYLGVPLLAKGIAKGVLEVFNRSPLEPDDDWFNFLNAMAGQAAIAIDNLTLFKDLQRTNAELFLAYDRTLEGWSAALDLRDKETEGHTQRVTETTVRLAQEMGFSSQELINLRRGALLHDIGKMGIPDRILLKTGNLTEEEMQAMQLHPVYAYNLLYPIVYLRPALDIPYCHHEKWDGTGYPRGLKGEEIPLAARLFAVVDVWDALSSHRPYRDAWPEKKVIAYLNEQSGSHFDPQVVKTFIAMIERGHQDRPLS